MMPPSAPVIENHCPGSYGLYGHVHEGLDILRLRGSCDAGQDEDSGLVGETSIVLPVQHGLARVGEGEDFPGVLNGGQGAPQQTGHHSLKAGLPAPEGWPRGLCSHYIPVRRFYRIHVSMQRG